MSPIGFENVKTGGQSVFKIDRISKHTCSLICNTKACGHRLTIEHDIPTVESGKYRGRSIGSTVGKNFCFLNIFYENNF